MHTTAFVSKGSTIDLLILKDLSGLTSLVPAWILTVSDCGRGKVGKFGFLRANERKKSLSDVDNPLEVKGRPK